jgi:hypothetical protein
LEVALPPSAPPRVNLPKILPLTAKPREIASGTATANPICGFFKLFLPPQ